MEPVLNTQPKHALLGASSSHRWLHCTPSAVAERRYPDEGSDFAKEGSLAHALAARRLKEELGRPHEEEDREISELWDRYHSGEMDEYVDSYVAYVLGIYQDHESQAKAHGHIRPEIDIELRLDYSQWVPEGFGTGDAVIVTRDTVEVIDLKYGKGVAVDARDNPQMKLYALGAIDLLDYAYDPETVCMTIFQPRIGNLSRWSIGVQELMDWAEDELEPLAKLASRGLGVRSSGEWCKFCKAKGDCAVLASACLSTYTLNPDAESFTAADLAGILPRLDTISDWVNAVKERSLARALSGETIPGYKIVEGRSVRKVTDPDKLADILMRQGYSYGQIFKPV